MGITIGIDLGTTNTCVASADGYEAKVIQNFQGYRTMPSMVAVGAAGKLLVGHIAKRQAVTNPTNTIYASKRLIGRRFDSPEVKQAIKMSPFDIVEGPHNDARIRVTDTDYSPQEIAGHILTEIKQFASEALGQEISDAIVTVPAYFNDNQRQATKDAGRIAGLNILRVLNEPTAACIAYGVGKRKDEKVVVFDFGGGTFDVSVVHVNGDVFEVLATGGDSFLGGEDLDLALMEHFIDFARTEYGVDLSSNPLAMQRLKLAAEEAKKSLSFQPVEDVVLPFLTAGADGKPVNFEYQLTREGLEELSQPFVERTISITMRTISACGEGVESIDHIILVGGQTRMPMVQSKIQQLFGKPARKGINPDEVVAVGAAIDAAALSGAEGDLLLMDVTPLQLGIATQGDIFTVLVDKNTRVPVKRKHVFTTVMDNQETVKLQAFQGDSPKASENELLGEFSLKEIRAAPRGDPKIEVEFSIDSDGTVSVSAKDLDTGKSQVIEVNGSNQLNESEILALMEESRNFAVDSFE